MQLLPSVARGVASRLEPPRAPGGGVADDVTLGAALLGLLLREHGSLLVAAAAYNGAPENAQAWVKKWGAMSTDVFVERIPFKETRDYVKKVLSVEAIYRGLDGADVALALPDALVPATSVTLFPYDE